MALTYAKLADIQTIPSTTGVIYANGASEETFIGSIILHNTNTTTEKVQVFNVPDNAGSTGTATLAHRFICVDLAADATISYPCPGNGLPLTDTNDSIQASSTTAGKVTIQLSGTKQV